MAADIHFAIGGAIFGELKASDVEMIGRKGKGFPGIEPYRSMSMAWVARPRELKALLDDNGVRLITASNGGPGQSTEFVDPAARQQTIADHLAFCRDFLSVFGCTWFKINMGRRPAGGTTPEQVKAIADTVTELGRRTLGEHGIKIAPHPHIWGPIERPEEVRGLLDQTDPAYVWWIPDTAQLNLGGGDPLQLMTDYYDRLAAVHWKDSKASYRGWTGPTPTQEQHRQEILYKDLGAGGVDHPAIYRMLVDRGYRGWITLDLDPPRPNEGEGTVEQKIDVNLRYLRETLQVGAL
ncbi:MAG TPA: TIM barrel protein [Chloroflexota bacterium]|nr:TIM barrel protein [Chloroflexota bacterium]